MLGPGLNERYVYGDVKRGNGVDLPGERHSKATPCSAQVVETGIRYNAGSSRPRLRVQDCRLCWPYQDTPCSTYKRELRSSYRE